MRFSLWIRGDEQDLEKRLLGGLLGGDSGITASATPDGGLLGGVLGDGGSDDKTAAPAAATNDAPAASTTPAAGLLGGIGNAADGLLSPVLGISPPSGASSTGGALLDLGIGPLSVAIAPSSGPLINAGIGATSSPLLNVGIDPTGTLLGVGLGPISAGVAPLATSGPIVSVGAGATSSSAAPKTTSIPVASTPPASTLAPSSSKSIAPATTSSKAAPASSSPAVVVATTKATSIISLSSAAESITNVKASRTKSIAQERPTDPTTLLTSVTAAPDTVSTNFAIAISSVGVTGGAETTNLATNGIQQSPQNPGHTNTIMILIIVGASVGGLAVFLGFISIMRRVFRKRRLGRAEYPPNFDDPLLPPMEDTFLPPRIARTISHRSKTSIDSSVSGGNNIMSMGPRDGPQPPTLLEEKQEYEQRGMPSPLPPIARAPEQEGRFQGTQYGRAPQRSEPVDMAENVKSFGLPR